MFLICGALEFESYSLTCHIMVSVKMWQVTQGGAYIANMGGCRAVYDSIAHSTSDFFVCPRAFLVLGRKNPRFRGYTVVYIPPTPHIYITYIYRYPHIFRKKKMFKIRI